MRGRHLTCAAIVALLGFSATPLAAEVVAVDRHAGAGRLAGVD